ncbi:MAG: NAD(P)-dependent oxidoreductase, partial [Patescibacteria group bacterium]
LDITDPNSLESYLRNNLDIDVIINFASYTDVAAAEKERPPARRVSGPEGGKKKGLSWKLNVEGAENTASVAKKYSKFLIHISTDFVFLGTKSKPGPYKEDARLPRFSDKISWYGWTKLEGEKRVRKLYPSSAIVRISYPFRAAAYPQKIDLARKILSLYDDGSLYPLFTDHYITVLFIDDIVSPLTRLIELKIKGVYHIANSGKLSHYRFGEYLLRSAKGIRNAPEKGSLVEFLKAPGRNARPIWGGLDTKKTQEALSIKFRTWREAVDEFVRQLQN